MGKRSLIALHKKLCKELNIKPCPVRFHKRSHDGDNYGVYRTRRREIVIYLDILKEGGKDPRRTLAHETYHHYQREIGLFCGKTGHWYKRDKPYQFLSWSQRPWERGAVRYERKIAEREGWK